MIVIENLSHKATPPSDMIKRHVDFLRDKGSKGKINDLRPLSLTEKEVVYSGG